MLGWSGGLTTDFWVPEIVMWVSNRLGCLRGCRVMFYFLCVLDFIFFVNNRGSDAVLGINDI